MSDIERAKEILSGGDYTCVLCREDVTFTDKAKGISPMLDFIGKSVDLRGFSAADRIVGKAAAILFVNAGVIEVYAEVMSRAGMSFLAAHGVKHSYGMLTEKIINRDQTDICPMEKAVKEIKMTADIDEICSGVELLMKKRSELRGA